MHPSKSFEWTDETQMLAFLAERSFAHIFCQLSDGSPAVVHAPILVTQDGRIQFHLSRRNRAAGHVDGNRLLVSIVGRDAYQSANWYVSDDQVPTWHYEAVEVEGVAREMTPDELVGLLDRLSDRFEGIYSPERPWTRAKMKAGKFEAMTQAIVGFEIVPDAFRGTRKFNQHKSDADAAAMIAGQESVGRADVVAAILASRRN